MREISGEHRFKFKGQKQAVGLRITEPTIILPGTSVIVDAEDCEEVIALQIGAPIPNTEETEK